MRSIAGALAGLLLAGCLRADVNRCDKGAICKQDQACTGQLVAPDPKDQHPLCGPPDLVAACHGLGLDQFDSCDYSSSQKGTCHWGICDPCSANPTLAGCYSDQWLTMLSDVGDNFTGVWVAGTSAAYAITDRGHAIWYDGFGWRHIDELEALANGDPLLSISGSGDPLELFVVGSSGTIYHLAGSWSKTMPASARPLVAVWAADRTHVIAVGVGEIWKFDGSTWSTMGPLGTPFVNFHGVWGTSASDVYAAGETDLGLGQPDIDGVIRHFDGTTWGPAHGLPDTPLFGIGGSGPQDVFAAGKAAGPFALTHYDGSSWTDVSKMYAVGVAVWASAPDDVFVGGESGIYRYDGSSPTAASAWQPSSPSVVTAIHGSARRNIMAVGPSGAIWRYARN